MEDIADSIAVDLVFDPRMNVVPIALLAEEQSEYLVSHRHTQHRKEVEDTCSAEVEDSEMGEYERIVVVLNRNSCLDLRMLVDVVEVRGTKLKVCRQRRSILLLPWLI